MKQPKDIMCGKAYDFDGCAIEFGHEPAHYFSKIGREHLPPAHQCGMAAAAAKRGPKTALEK
jgi:hypothetical protein